MKPDYAKATAELLERLRKRKTTDTMQGAIPQASQVYINAPMNCVIVIAPPQRQGSDDRKATP